MKKTWTVNGKGNYPSLAVAMLMARRKFPAAVFGEPHQGGNGRMAVIGKLGEANDPVVIEQVTR